MSDSVARRQNTKYNVELICFSKNKCDCYQEIIHHAEEECVYEFIRACRRTIPPHSIQGLNDLDINEFYNCIRVADISENNTGSSIMLMLETHELTRSIIFKIENQLREMYSAQSPFTKGS
jgi:hypothetical protein